MASHGRAGYVPVTQLCSMQPEELWLGLGHQTVFSHRKDRWGAGRDGKHRSRWRAISSVGWGREGSIDTRSPRPATVHTSTAPPCCCQDTLEVGESSRERNTLIMLFVQGDQQAKEPAVDFGSTLRYNRAQRLEEKLWEVRFS